MRRGWNLRGQELIPHIEWTRGRAAAVSLRDAPSSTVWMLTRWQVAKGMKPPWVGKSSEEAPQGNCGRAAWPRPLQLTSGNPR